MVRVNPVFLDVRGARPRLTHRLRVVRFVKREGENINSLVFLLRCGDIIPFQSPGVGTIFAPRPVERRAEGRVVLNNLSEQVRECLEHAEDCARNAAALPDGSTLREDFLNLEKNWRSLARSLQLGERLTDFTSYTKHNAGAPITPFLRGQAFDPETIEAMGKAFVTTCETLGLSEQDAALTQLVAQKIIVLAERGLKTTTALHLAAIKEFRSDPH
jgi:hypothetical protein